MDVIPAGTRRPRPGGGHTDDKLCPPDEELVASALNGDLAAFNRLVERYQRLVFAVCLRLLRDPGLAEDVTQEAFVRAYSALDQFQGGAFRPWLLRIATNRAYDVLRYHHRRPSESLEAQVVEQEPRWSVESPPDDPEDFAGRAELSRRLEAALAALPEDQRLVVLLHDVHGYQYEEIARITDVSLGTVKSRLSRARARLRDILRSDDRSRELLESVGRQLNDEEA